jgi:hypothetical protein
MNTAIYIFFFRKAFIYPKTIIHYGRRKTNIDCANGNEREQGKKLSRIVCRSFDDKVCR